MLGEQQRGCARIPAVFGAGTRVPHLVPATLTCCRRKLLSLISVGQSVPCSAQRNALALAASCCVPLAPFCQLPVSGPRCDPGAPSLPGLGAARWGPRSARGAAGGPVSPGLATSKSPCSEQEQQQQPVDGRFPPHGASCGRGQILLLREGGNGAENAGPWGWGGCSRSWRGCCGQDSARRSSRGK